MSTQVIQGLRTVLYRVTDIEKGKAFYSAILGIQPYFAEVFYVGFNVGGFELGLEPCEELQGTGGVVGYWGVSDVNEGVKHMLAHGAELNEDVADVGEGIKVASFKDPWGNIFGIIENPNFNPATVK